MQFKFSSFRLKHTSKGIPLREIKYLLLAGFFTWIFFACAGQGTTKDAFIKGLPIEEWSKAGAEKVDTNLPTVEIAPGADLQQKIEELQGRKPVVLKLNPGKYYLSRPLQLQSNVYLAGVHRDSVWIISNFKRPFHPEPFDTPCSIEFQDLEKSGIRNLTLLYQPVAFEPYERQEFYEMWDNKVFKNNPNGDTLLYVGHIGVKRSKQVIIENCNIFNAGTDPIILADAHHVSILNTHVKSAYNKGGKGNGYFNIDANSSYVLVKDNKIEKIRHLSIQNGAHHNVIVGNDLEVDVNFHNGDAGYNLVEGNSIRIPEWHGWHCFSAGAKTMHQAPGPHNYLFNNLTQYKQYIPVVRPVIAEYGDFIVYKTAQIIDTVMIKEQPMVRYQLGPVDLERSIKSNRLFVMNDQWDDQKRVLFVKTLAQDKLYSK